MSIGAPPEGWDGETGFITAEVASELGPRERLIRRLVLVLTAAVITVAALFSALWVG